MGLLSKLIGGTAVEPIQAVGKVAEGIFGSKDRKLTHQEFMAELAAQPQTAMQELSKIEAQHRSVFVAGWRPFIGWVCGVGLSFTFVLNPIIQWITSSPGPELPSEIMYNMVLALLGLGALRTAEKFQGRAK